MKNLCYITFNNFYYFFQDESVEKGGEPTHYSELDPKNMIVSSLIVYLI